MNILSFSFSDIGNIIYGFFHPTFEGYTNFSFTENEQKMLPLIVFGIFLGVFLAAFYTLYIRSVLGEFARKLNDGKVYSAEGAMTLEQLGFGKNLFVRQALRNPHSLRRVVHSVEFDAYLESKSTKNYKYNPKTEHFYLPEEDKYKAEMRFGKRKTEWHTILFVLLGIVLCEIIVFAALPEIVSLFDRVVSMFSIKGNTVTH